MGRTIPTTPDPARGADGADAAAAPAATTPDASTDATTTAPAASIAPPDDPTTTPDPITPDADALAARLADAIAAAIDATDPTTGATPDGPAGDALTAARLMGRHAVRRERVLTDALMVAIGNDPATAPAAVAVVASIRAALAVASTPEPVDPVALAVDRVLAFGAVVASIAWADPAALTGDGAPAWARSIGDAIPTGADRDAFRAAVRDRLTAAADAIDPADPAAPIVAAVAGLASIDDPGTVPAPAWGSMRASTRGSGGDPIAYAVAAFPIAWDARPAGAAVVPVPTASRVAACYRDGGYGVDGAPAVPSSGTVQNAAHDGRIPGWRLVTRPGTNGRNAWGILPADDPTPAGWHDPAPRERGRRDA